MNDLRDPRLWPRPLNAHAGSSNRANAFGGFGEDVQARIPSRFGFGTERSRPAPVVSAAGLFHLTHFLVVLYREMYDVCTSVVEECRAVELLLGCAIQPPKSGLKQASTNRAS